MSARTRAVASLAVVVLVAVLGALVSGGGDPAPDRQPSQSGARSDRTGTSGLPTVDRADLPREAQETLELIEDDGPFPYDRDGVTFHNYEELLPERPDGYYREYTVPTPGRDDRGPRRIVEGEPREWFWTEDHYASFLEVLP